MHFAFIICVFSSWLGICIANADDGATAVRSAEDVIQRWQPGQHLYVKGDVGVGEDQLANLERWLDQYGTHWTVVLLQHAEDESYRTLDNRQFHGMDAVEYALGHGLANRTEFGTQIHPQTSEPDGAVFVLFLAEKKFSYYGSDAQDRRSLGESRWVGDLDREAFRAMRNGGRIIDAVKNTVSLVQTRLATKLRAEKIALQQAEADREQAIRKRQRDWEHQHLLLEELEQKMLPQVKQAAIRLSKAFPAAEQTRLVEPPLQKWISRAAILQVELAESESDESSWEQGTANLLNSKRSIEKLRAEVDQILDQYAAHQSFGQMMSPLEQRLDAVADQVSDRSTESVDEAYRVLEEARIIHAQGDIDFIERIQQGNDLIQLVEQEVQLDNQRLQQQQAQRDLIGRTISIVVSVLGALVLGWLWLLNRWRRPALRRSHQVFDRSSRAVETGQTAIDNLEQEVVKILGTEEEYAGRSYLGRTVELGNEIRSQVSDLKRLQHEANNTIQAAARLLHPANPLAEAANMFSSSRYQHCENLLQGPSLPYSTSTDGKQQDWLTFDVFFKWLNDQIGKTKTSLISFEDTLTRVGDEFDQLQGMISQASGIEQELSNASRQDHFFPVPALFDQVLPAAQLESKQASQVLESDPIRAMEDHIPQAKRLLVESLQIAESIQDARSEVFQQLDSASQKLQKMDYKTDWIDERLVQLGDQANGLMEQAIAQTVSSAADEFDLELKQLGVRAKRSAELALDLKNRVSKRLEDLQIQISETGAKLSTQLGIGIDSVLQEPGYQPAVELRQAREQLQAAQAAIAYGGVESARESMEIIDIEAETANDLLDDSLAAALDFQQHWDRLQSRLKQLEAPFAETESKVEVVSERFVNSALRLRSDFIAENDQLQDQASINDCLTQAGHLVVAVKEACVQSQQLQSQGNVLQAANIMGLADADLDWVNESLEQIQEHCQLLNKQTDDNRFQIERIVQRVERSKHDVNDPRSQRETIELRNRLDSQSRVLFSDLQKNDSNRDPFIDQARISEFGMSTDTLLALVRSDRAEHAEAARIIEGADAELDTAGRSVNRALHDRVPDSATINRCQQSVADLGAEIQKLKSRFESEHEDWQSIGHLTHQLTSELAVADGELRRELELAQTAVKELQLASEKISGANRWRGDYGIQIGDDVGSMLMQQARANLAEGEYVQTIELARSAAYRAKQSLDVARRRVAAKRQEIARAAAAARRRRQQSSLFSGGSIGRRSSKSSGISFGGRSSRSSSASSSSRSSGHGSSGFRRSGW